MWPVPVIISSQTERQLHPITSSPKALFQGSFYRARSQGHPGSPASHRLGVISWGATGKTQPVRGPPMNHRGGWQGRTQEPNWPLLLAGGPHHWHGDAFHPGVFTVRGQPQSMSTLLKVKRRELLQCSLYLCIRCTSIPGWDSLLYLLCRDKFDVRNTCACVMWAHRSGDKVAFEWWVIPQSRPLQEKCPLLLTQMGNDASRKKVSQQLQ